MKPIMQTILSTPEEPGIGNCFSACLASLLEIPLEAVPYFAVLGKDWFRPFEQLLLDNKCAYWGQHWPKGEKFMVSGTRRPFPGVDGYYIVGGASKRSFVTQGHAVIFKDGEMVHDPHPEGTGLAKPEDIYMIVRKDEA